MTIDQVRTYAYTLELPEPLHLSTYTVKDIHNVLIEIESDGMVGVGYTFFFRPGEAAATRALVRELALSSADVTRIGVQANWARLFNQINWIGQSGLGMIALSMVDTALWDLHAQRAGMPLFRLLGGERTAIPAYATGGWISQPIEEVIAMAQRFVASGFRAVKVKVGSPDYRTDVARCAALRDALGDSIQIMVDANQAWYVHDAVTAGKAFGDVGVTWFEEPVRADDFSGAAEVVSSIDIPVAAGENLFGPLQFKPLFDARAVDIAMPDLMRCGGPTGFLQVASLAAAHQLPVSSHTFSEVSAHLMSAVPNGTVMECIPGWWEEMFDEAPRFAEGSYHLSDRPGLGMVFAERAKSQAD